MPSHNLTPYDFGSVLEPKLWVNGKTTGSPGHERPAETDDYGRVDFDDDEGNTVFTVRIAREGTGRFRLELDNHQQVDVRLDTVDDRAFRADAEQRLAAELEAIAAEYGALVTFDSEAGPHAFATGHYVIESATDPRQYFAVTMTYPGADDADVTHPDTVATGWEAHSVVEVQRGLPFHDATQAGTMNDIAWGSMAARQWCDAYVARQHTTTSPVTPASSPTVSPGY